MIGFTIKNCEGAGVNSVGGHRSTTADLGCWLPLDLEGIAGDSVGGIHSDVSTVVAGVNRHFLTFFSTALAEDFELDLFKRLGRGSGALKT